MAATTYENCLRQMSRITICQAESVLRQGNIPLAVTRIQIALALDPENGRAHRLLSTLQSLFSPKVLGVE